VCSDIQVGFVPAALEVVEESEFDFGRDVGVGLDDRLGRWWPRRRVWAISVAPLVIGHVL